MSSKFGVYAWSSLHLTVKWFRLITIHFFFCLDIHVVVLHGTVHSPTELCWINKWFWSVDISFSLLSVNIWSIFSVNQSSIHLIHFLCVNQSSIHLNDFCIFLLVLDDILKIKILYQLKNLFNFICAHRFLNASIDVVLVMKYTDKLRYSVKEIKIVNI